MRHLFETASRQRTKLPHPRRQGAALRGLRCAGCTTAATARVVLGIAVSLCASLATLAVVVLCFLLVHYQVPQNRVTSDLLMFAAGAALAALYRAGGRKLRYSLDLAASDAAQLDWARGGGAARWGDRELDDEGAV